MARTLITLLLFLSAADVYAQDEKTALVLFGIPKEVAVAARTKLTSSLASAGHPLAGLNRTRTLFDQRELGALTVARIEEIRARAGLEKLIVIDSAVPPQDGLAVFRIRIFSGEEPQLRFQATSNGDQQSAQVVAESVVQLIGDWSKGRSASH